MAVFVSLWGGRGREGGREKTTAGGRRDKDGEERGREGRERRRE